jgi:hypothetical protein
MKLIRARQPRSFEEWESWYLSHATTEGKIATRVSEATLDERGDRLWEKLQTIVIPEWQNAFQQITVGGCRAYIRNLAINRTYDGYVREKSVVFGKLASRFGDVRFEETPPELDHAGDVDFFGWVGAKAFGLQIKPVTGRANFGGYSQSERMRASFDAFTEEFGGRVFVVYSIDDEIANAEVVDAIAREIRRLEPGGG